ncbi:MAG: DHH family phosphoesterase [Myxococcales bacterium]|nr:DHH family phosphoesterase [Myxococcales bacterium]
MPPLDFRVRRAQERAIAVLARGLGMSDVVARVLLGRGIDELAAAQRFVAPRLGELRPPAGLAGFERGVGRIAAAVTAGHAIGVFGDYDVDGVTTAALLTSFLRSVGAHVEVQVAHREQGYGFSVEVAQELLARGAQLIITGDCGTSDLAALELVRDRGVDVVIIDHHTVPEKGQAHPSYALINPLCDDSTFPFRGMASVGLAFYVAGAVRTKLRQLGHFTARGLAEPDVRDLLDLVALGTIADLVPLTDGNRILITHGLKRGWRRGRARGWRRCWRRWRSPPTPSSMRSWCRGGWRRASTRQGGWARPSPRWRCSWLTPPLPPSAPPRSRTRTRSGARCKIGSTPRRSSSWAPRIRGPRSSSARKGGPPGWWGSSPPSWWTSGNGQRSWWAWIRRPRKGAARRAALAA